MDWKQPPAPKKGRPFFPASSIIALPRYGQEWYDLFIATVVFIFIALTVFQPIGNGDLWWHLAAGEEVLQRGPFATEDTFTFTVQPEYPEFHRPWMNHVWLADAILYSVHAGLGAPGLVFFRAALVIGVFAVMLSFTMTAGVPLSLGSLVLLMACFISYGRFTVRPHLFSYALLVATVVLLMRFRDTDRRIFLYVLPPMMLLWANLHLGFFAGLMVFALIFLGDFLQQAFPQIGKVKKPLIHDWRFALGIFALCVVATFLTPHPIGTYLTLFETEQKTLLQATTMEWYSPLNIAMREAPFFIWYMLWLALMITTYLLVSWRRFDFGGLLASFGFCFLSLYAHRFRVEFVLVSYFFITYNLANVREVILPRFAREHAFVKQLRVRNFWPVAVVLSLFLMQRHMELIRLGMGVRKDYPKHVSAFLDANKIDGPIFNSIDLGGALVWESEGEREVFIDGRNFSPELYRVYTEVLTGGYSYDDLREKYGVEAFVLRFPMHNETATAQLHRRLWSDYDYGLVYADDDSLVYLYKGEQYEQVVFAHQFYEYNPATFDPRLPQPPETWESLTAELKRAHKAAPELLLVATHFAEIAPEIGKAQDAEEMLKQVLQRAPNDIDLLLDLAYLCAETQRPDEALRILEGLPGRAKRRPKYWVTEGTALLQKLENDQARDAFERALEIDPEYVYAYQPLVRLYQGSGDVDKATELATRMTRKLPSLGESFYVRGLVYHDQGDCDAARDYYETALERGNPPPLLYRDAGRCFMAQSDVESARRSFFEYLRWTPPGDIYRSEVERDLRKLDTVVDVSGKR